MKIAVGLLITILERFIQWILLILEHVVLCKIFC